MNKNLVLFIHGLTGGYDTWKNSRGELFADLLKSDSEINSNFDFREFEYFTKIVNVKNSMLSHNLVKLVNFVPGINLPVPKRKKNVSFLTLSEELATFIQFDCSEYENIVIVAHSMGGLISKKFILDLNDNSYDEIHSKVVGYLSLATPHRGSIPALIVSKANINAKELKPLAKETADLNDRWVESVDKLPRARYVIAKNDDFVSEVSSVPSTTNKTKFKSSFVDHDHSSICKPESEKDISLKIVKKFLLDIKKAIEMEQSLSIEYDPSLNSYDKEIFVVKMILAHVEEGLIDDAKESFFYTDLILKSASRKDRETFEQLKVKVMSMYKTYSSCSGKKSTSEIVKEIHEKIIELDKTSIDCVLSYVNFIHKKGLLHHEANQRNLIVNWCKDVSIDDIEQEIANNV
ncbi:ABC-three component system protein [Vibrio campbellii]|uniref:ABC-three component system protein n=1 Tax=Vibrio campbellii TaxID=680 RepID=UPI001F48D9C8|nr:ABC-three component system protein [Vibrio campbellii]MCE7730236.1 GPI inositol-deacylase [Vibrio campbellii]